VRNRLRTANFYHFEIKASTHFDAEVKAKNDAFIDEEQFWTSSVHSRAGSLAPAVESVQLAFQLLELLSRIAQFSLRGQALIVFEIFGSTLDERVEIV
jgi:hypothetical protein